MTWYQDGYDDGFKDGRKGRKTNTTDGPLLDRLNDEIRALNEGRFGHLFFGSPPDDIIQAALDLIRGKPR